MFSGKFNFQKQNIWYQNFVVFRKISFPSRILIRNVCSKYLTVSSELAYQCLLVF
eukprot:UN13882